MQLKQVDLQIRMGKLELDAQKAQADGSANDEAQMALEIAKTGPGRAARDDEARDTRAHQARRAADQV